VSTLQVSSFELRLPLQPKARPRFSGQGRAYTDSRYREWMQSARAILGEWWTLPPLDQNKVVVVSVLFRGPGVSDLDNLLGAVLDAGKGVLWVDDRVTIISRVEASWRQSTRADQSIKLSIVWSR
jgi:Holliday junction resolvase RusA-like endonuclease